MANYVLNVSRRVRTWEELDAFTQGYIEAAMWTMTDDDGGSLDRLGLQDVHPETIRKAITDCVAFQQAHRATLDRATEETGRPDSYHGHDFWLTRNHHGTGFWDRGYSEDVAKVLSDASQGFGECDWYLGDDGLVHG